MKSPKNMKTIQIDITNACPNKCSNCTRFCGWHEKSFFMDFETFKKAVDSLQGYQGQIGIMGGQPTLHPEFEKFVDYLASKNKQNLNINRLIIPEDDFSYYYNANLSFLEYYKNGLWSSLGNKYYENFELISDTFGYQCLNDHSNFGNHQALLVSRKDLGINDAQFKILRERCWIQNLWSASITPKGCFFCEVAAALDMLFDGPGGLPIEKGWYLRRPQDFGEQLNWCEYCSACLRVPSKKGNQGIDIVSPTLLKMLQNKNSYKAKNKCYQVFTKERYDRGQGKINNSVSQPYLNSDEVRISSNNSSIFPHKINVYFQNKNINVNWINKSNVIDTKISVQQLENKKFDDWCLIIKNNCDIDCNIFKRVYNPGVLYINQNYYFVNKRAKCLRDYKISNDVIKFFDEDHKCFIGKFHVDKQSIKYSFLIPTYNSSDFIKKSIESVLNQDYSNFNIYFVDDGSTDNTIEIIQKYMQQDNRIKSIIKNEVNSSAVISRNKLIDCADGDYSIWCDSDDEVNSNMCSFATWLIQQEGQFDIIDFPFKVINVNNSVNCGFKGYQGRHKFYGKECYDYFTLNKVHPFNLWSKVIKTTLLKKMKVDDVRIDLVDDMVFGFPLYWNCQSYYSVNSERMYKYYYGNGGWGNTNLTYDKYVRNCEGIKKAYDLNYKFLLNHSPQKKYFRIIYSHSCVFQAYNMLCNIREEQKLKATHYYKYNFNQESFFQ